jgi:para-aminobenzoate synthetase/4-amino-4-deoxychorismate lyase
MELIHEIERDARGPYCGAIGRIDASGDAAFNVAIRTLRLTGIENGQGSAVLGVGSAIVADSDAMDERRECEIKAAFARASSPTLTAPAFDLIESMLFEPDSGIALLDLHLDRIKASAAELGFAFDRHRARNKIQALCFELDQRCKLRLKASRAGFIALEALEIAAPAAEMLTCIALPLPIDSGDWRLRHKTTDRVFYEDALAAAQGEGADEALLVRPDGLITEGSVTNVFVEREGVLLTPPAALGLLPGVLRRSLIESGRAQEAELTLEDLEGGFMLGNAVRGLCAARLLP